MASKNTFKSNKSEGAFLRSNILVNNNLMGWFSHYSGAINYQGGVPVKMLPKILWLVLLGIIYIGIKHDANNTIRQLNKTRSAVDDLKVDYTTLKADYMYASKQTEVAKKVQPLGLEESRVPIYKLKGGAE